MMLINSQLKEESKDSIENTSSIQVLHQPVNFDSVARMWANCCIWMKNVCGNSRCQTRSCEDGVGICMQEYVNLYRSYSKNLHETCSPLNNFCNFSTLERIYVNEGALLCHFNAAVDCSYDFLLLNISGASEEYKRVEHVIVVKLKNCKGRRWLRWLSPCCMFDPICGQKQFKTHEDMAREVYGSISAFTTNWSRVLSVGFTAIHEVDIQNL
ncbi:hypothetical protein ACJJIK_02025 [Microbulbifer sp. ZKSA006]|uniref:hypothetical protein n=1 Tax=Microbulbifer sp. ZKSA006 TaxID=3243390 RepID=UPI004039C0A7